MASSSSQGRKSRSRRPTKSSPVGGWNNFRLLHARPESAFSVHGERGCARTKPKGIWSPKLRRCRAPPGFGIRENRFTSDCNDEWKFDGSCRKTDGCEMRSNGADRKRYCTGGAFSALKDNNQFERAMAKRRSKSRSRSRSGSRRRSKPKSKSRSSSGRRNRKATASANNARGARGGPGTAWLPWYGAQRQQQTRGVALPTMNSPTRTIRRSPRIQALEAARNAAASRRRLLSS